MKKLIVISDWASDSLTCQEVRSAVEGFVKDPSCVNISFVASTPATIHTSFIISQIVQTESRYGQPLETVIFQNTDPRVQTEEGVEQAKGAEFVIIRLSNGMYLCGPNAGYDFSMIKDQVSEVFIYPGADKGSQFRSRDLYAKISAYLMDGLEDDMELEEVSVDTIPTLQGFYVGHIDNFGNIKTTLSHEDMKGKCEIGDEVAVTINGHTKKVKYVSNLFGGTPGELVIYPGSSGKPGNNWMEITVWRHFTGTEVSTGLQAFENPRPGMKIELK
ncbi:hypothetical protein HGB07_03255 [Candidatus Roizmanbacteria bacterium]|nr:hypothetical protein [Candidatus Roizmanbacteria bacterium]